MHKTKAGQHVHVSGAALYEQYGLVRLGRKTLALSSAKA